MKKTLKSISMLAAAFVALAAVSCTKEETPSAEQENGISTITLSIEQPTAEDATKTALGDKSGESYPINWSTGDSIAVSRQSAAEFKKYTLQSGDGTQSGTFSGESIEGAVYAYYPYANVNGVSTQTYTVTIPDEQQYVAGSFGNGAMPMYAKADAAGSLQSMKPLMSVLKISLTGSCKVHSIFLQSASVNLSGAATVDMSNGDVSFTTGKKYILLTCGEGVQLSGEATTFHIVVPATAAAVTDFTVTIKDDRGYTMKKNLSTSNKFTAKVIKNVSTALPVSTSFSTLTGEFSIDASNKIQFSNGNLYAKKVESTWTWGFYADQHQYNSYPVVGKYGKRTAASTDTEIDHFCWGYNATGSVNPVEKEIRSSFTDWGQSISTLPGNSESQKIWKTLKSSEWTWILGPKSSPNPGTNCRTSSTINGTANARYAEVKVNGVCGLLIFPDAFTWPEGISTSQPTTFNANESNWNSVDYTAAEFILLESAGCVFLPAAGYRYGSFVYFVGSSGDYWSSTPYGKGFGTGCAYFLDFDSDDVPRRCFYYRYNGYCVRLVCAAQ